MIKSQRLQNVTMVLFSNYYFRYLLLSFYYFLLYSVISNFLHKISIDVAIHKNRITILVEMKCQKLNFSKRIGPTDTDKISMLTPFSFLAIDCTYLITS